MVALPFRPDGISLRIQFSEFERHVAVEDGDVELDFCDLLLEVPRHQRLALIRMPILPTSEVVLLFSNRFGAW